MIQVAKCRVKVSQNKYLILDIRKIILLYLITKMQELSSSANTYVIYHKNLDDLISQLIFLN